MTPDQRDSLGTYVRRTADLIGLKDWTLYICDAAPKEEEWVAQCDPWPGRKHAELAFRQDFFTRNPDEQRSTIVHELIHCHLAGMSHLVRVTLAKELGQSAYTLFEDAYRSVMEYAVDGLADALSGGFPLPEWPKEGDDNGRQAESEHTSGSSPAGEQGPAKATAEEVAA